MYYCTSESTIPIKDVVKVQFNCMGFGKCDSFCDILQLCAHFPRQFWLPELSLLTFFISHIWDQSVRRERFWQGVMLKCDILDEQGWSGLTGCPMQEEKEEEEEEEAAAHWMLAACCLAGCPGFFSPCDVFPAAVRWVLPLIDQPDTRICLRVTLS